ncbi:hypothetical protein N7490_006673 [Penicillium lividum]|nr:hypothetical protein N7490_006673 [Penicillium lividum]
MGRSQPRSSLYVQHESSVGNCSATAVSGFFDINSSIDYHHIMKDAYVSAVDLCGGSRTRHPLNMDDRHSESHICLRFIPRPPPRIRLGEEFKVTIGLPSIRQPDSSPLFEGASEAVHLSLRLAENNASVNLLSGNLTSSIARANGHSPYLVTFNGIGVTKTGRFRLRALLGIDSVVGVTIASTVDSDVFVVLA